MKPCNICLEVKTLADYYVEKRGADGHMARCKVCMRAIKAAYRLENPNSDHEYYVKARQPKLSEVRAAYAADSRIREKVAKLRKAYYWKNPDIGRAKSKAWALQNTDYLVAYRVEYRKRPGWREYDNEASRKYRAKPENKQALAHRTAQYAYRKLNAPGVSTKAQLKARWDYYGGKCWLCGIDAKEMDHVKPLTKGGSHWPGNLRPICRSCNARKSNTWPFNKLITPISLRLA